MRGELGWLAVASNAQLGLCHPAHHSYLSLHVFPAFWTPTTSLAHFPSTLARSSAFVSPFVDLGNLWHGLLPPSLFYALGDKPVTEAVSLHPCLSPRHDGALFSALHHPIHPQWPSNTPQWTCLRRTPHARVIQLLTTVLNSRQTQPLPVTHA